MLTRVPCSVNVWPTSFCSNPTFLIRIRRHYIYCGPFQVTISFCTATLAISPGALIFDWLDGSGRMSKGKYAFYGKKLGNLVYAEWNGSHSGDRKDAAEHLSSCQHAKQRQVGNACLDIHRNKRRHHQTRTINESYVWCPKQSLKMFRLR